MEIKEQIKNLREETGLNRKDFAEHFGIPLRTVEDWEAGRRTPPEYLPRLMFYQIKYEEMQKRSKQSEKCDKIIETDKNILITTDSKGKKLVVIPQIIFSGKQNIAWTEVERYLLRYVGKIVEVAETKDIIYLGKNFTDEFTGSIYTRKLKGGAAKAKANMVQGIPQMIEIATARRWNVDFAEKHGKKAELGWYRYNTRFALPVMTNDGAIERYNIYQAVIIVRCAADNKLYLYDIQNIKKETSNPS